MELSSIVIATLLGTVLGGLLFWLPGIGVASFAGVFMAGFGSALWILSNPETVLVFFMALTVSGAFAAIIPAFFFAAPQASTIFLVCPGNIYRLQGRSLQGALAAGRGCLTGVLLLTFLAPLFLYLYGPLRGFIRPRVSWALAGLVLYMLGGEFLFHLRRAARSRRRDEYRALLIAPLIFLLTGLFGLLLFQYRQFPLVTNQGRSYAAIIGLFLLPPLIRRLLAPKETSGRKEAGKELFPESGAAFPGIISGGIGGLIALLVPGIGAGPGALVAGHLLPRKKEKAFLFSQGMVQSFAAVGGFLFFFLPERAFIRSAVARALSPYYHSSRHLQSFILIVAVILVSGGLSYLVFNLTFRLARAIAGVIAPRVLAIAIILFVIAIICFGYGPAHLPVLITGACLGSLPLFFNCRRSNSFAVILIPSLLFVLGWNDPLAALLGFR